MKTTELFVEQVFVGFLVLLIAALPFHPELLEQFGAANDLGTFGGIAVAAGLVGTAYLLGVVFDRLADSLLRGLDQHNRLRFALRGLKTWPDTWQDPFAEDRLRIRVFAKGGALVDWLDYLRSRIRLTRALATFGPGITLALVLATARTRENPALAWWLVVVPIAYVVLPTTLYSAALLLWPGRVETPSTGKGKKVRRYGGRRGYPGKHRARQRLALALDITLHPTTLSGLVLIGAAFWLAYHFSSRAAFGAALGGTSLTALAGWAWWRISGTFMRYLKNVEGFVAD